MPNTIPIVDLAASRVLFALPALTRYLKKRNPQVLLSALHYANIVALLAKKIAGVSTRVVVSERNHLSSTIKNTNNFKDKLLPLFMKRIYPWADEIVAVSNGVADDLALTLGLIRNKITTIYNPVITHQLHEQMLEQVDHPWLKDNIPLILAVGRLVPQKDFQTLIQAFALVRQHVKARLIILGEGAERKKLEAMVQRLQLTNDVQLPGFVANPFPFMYHASLFVLSSIREGLPGVLIQALACNCKIVSTDCPSGPNEILLNGRYGTLVPVGDVQSLANAISSAITSPTEYVVPGDWLKQFSADTITSEYIKVLFR